MLICRRIFCIASLFLAGILHACLKHVLQILAGEPKEDKWVIKHLKKAAKSQRTMDSSAWGYSRWDSQSFVAAHPWYGTLSSRHKSEIELLESKMGPAEINNLIGDLSQDARDAFNRHEGRVGCVTPGGLLWHFGLKRPLLGIEKLALQGIFPTEAVMEPFSDSMKSQLAGNAFNAPDFTAVFISLMAVARPIMHVSCGVCVCVASTADTCLPSHVIVFFLLVHALRAGLSPPGIALHMCIGCASAAEYFHCMLLMTSRGVFVLSTYVAQNCFHCMLPVGTYFIL